VKWSLHLSKHDPADEEYVFKQLHNLAIESGLLIFVLESTQDLCFEINTKTLTVSTGFQDQDEDLQKLDLIDLKT